MKQLNKQHMIIYPREMEKDSFFPLEISEDKPQILVMWEKDRTRWMLQEKKPRVCKTVY